MVSAATDLAWELVPVVLAAVLGIAVERLAVPRASAFALQHGLRGLGALARALGGNVIVVIATLPPLYAMVDRLSPGAGMRNDDHALSVLTVFATVVVIARLAADAIDELTRRTPLPAASLLRSLARGIVYLIGALIALQSLGVSIVPLLETLGVGGLAVALALRDTLANLFAGLQIIASRQVRPGDYIKIDTIEGTVADVTWRNTTIHDLANALVIVPNEKLAGAVVTNYSLRDGALVIEVPVGVAYESDLDRVERFALEVAFETSPRSDGAVRPYLRFRRFGDARIDLSIYFTVGAYDDQFALRSTFLKALQTRFKKENVALVPFAAVPVPIPLKKAQGGTRTLYDG